MNEPITITDIDEDTARRIVRAIYLGEWLPVAPTHIVGVEHLGLTYAVVGVNGEFHSVWRFTNKDVFKRLRRWPQELEALVT